MCSGQGIEEPVAIGCYVRSNAALGGTAAALQLSEVEWSARS